MKPKGIRKGGMEYKRPSMGYSGVTLDMLSSIMIEQTAISEEVEITKPTEPDVNISESVGVVVTP